MHLKSLHLENTTLEVEIRYNQRSKSMRLRLGEGKKRAFLTLPPRVSSKQIEGFLERSRPWLTTKLAQQLPQISFINGNVIPIFGQDYTICYSKALQSKIELRDNKLLIEGPCESLSSPVKSWLKYQAHTYLIQRCQDYANKIGKKVNQVRVREVKSRWGSCSHQGNLSFSWRLVFAPFPVIDYVCAHEVAHLVEMNHSKKFWMVLEAMCPDFKAHIYWLKKNSSRLFSYGNS